MERNLITIIIFLQTNPWKAGSQVQSSVLLHLGAYPDIITKFFPTPGPSSPKSTLRRPMRHPHRSLAPERIWDVGKILIRFSVLSCFKQRFS